MSIGNTGRFLRHVIRLPAGFFASRLCGELVQRVSYVELAAQFTVQTLMVNFSDCVGILAFGALLFVYDERARRRDGAQGHPGACEAERDADEIVVLDGGTVVERGTHDELMAKNGAYAHLVRNEG